MLETAGQPTGRSISCLPLFLFGGFPPGSEMPPGSVMLGVVWPPGTVRASHAASGAASNLRGPVTSMNHSSFSYRYTLWAAAVGPEAKRGSPGHVLTKAASRSNFFSNSTCCGSFGAASENPPKPKMMTKTSAARLIIGFLPRFRCLNIGLPEDRCARAPKRKTRSQLQPKLLRPDRFPVCQNAADDLFRGGARFSRGRWRNSG